MKKFIAKRLATAISMTCALGLSQQVLAQDDHHKFELHGAAGLHGFDTERNIDDTGFLGLGLGYVINPTWTVEAWWTDANSETDGSNVDMDVNEYRFDALYHLAGSGKWQPYLVAGVGDLAFDVDNDDKHRETRVNVGLGMKHSLTENLQLRGDLRAFNSLDEEQTDMAFQLGVSYLLGRSAPVVRDSDGDGVNDDADACPNTPPGAPVNAQGCPLDSDGDGVYDYRDECPNTAANLKVDDRGCPKTLEKDVSIELNVNFDTESAVVKGEYYSEIQRVADFMKEYGNTQVEVQGHTDSRGAASYNKDLSDRRAKAVADVLVNEFGIDRSRVSARGYGEERPVANNDSIEGRAANRRVVAEISATVETMQTR